MIALGEQGQREAEAVNKEDPVRQLVRLGGGRGGGVKSIVSEMVKYRKNVSQRMFSSRSATEQPNFTCSFVESPAERFSKLCAFHFILLGSLFGNIFRIIIVCKNRDLRKLINYFVVNMAFPDLVYPLILLPLQVTELVIDSRHWHVSGILGSICSKLFPFAS